MQPNGSIRGVRLRETCSNLLVFLTSSSSSSSSFVSFSFRKPVKRKSK